MAVWRYIAQRVLTGEFLDWGLPLDRDELTWELSGPGALRGTVSPDTGVLRAADGRLLLEKWGTLIHAEADGLIRWSGIVVRSEFSGSAWSVECAGLSTYPHGMPYTAEYSGIRVDPAAVVKNIWAHLQSQPDGDLGVRVVGSTPVRIGTDPKDVSFTTGSGDDVAFVAGPYELFWWESPDCGAEIDSLAAEGPFDWVEAHSWDGDTVDHRIEIAYPRAGRRRTDLAFVEGDNVISSIVVTDDGDDFANGVLGIGAGEGKGAVRRLTAVRDGRLRRVKVRAAKDVRSGVRLDSMIADDLRRMRDVLTVGSVTVRDHPNAPIGSWALGDDIEVRAVVPWLGQVDVWCRIVGWSLLSEDTAELVLERSDSFSYGG